MLFMFNVYVLLSSLSTLALTSVRRCGTGVTDPIIILSSFFPLRRTVSNGAGNIIVAQGNRTVVPLKKI